MVKFIGYMLEIFSGHLPLGIMGSSLVVWVNLQEYILPAWFPY
jgi:hypothetical protein